MSRLLFICLVLFFTVQFSGCSDRVKIVERPEKIVSKRQIHYDKQTYIELADLWKQYYDIFPSEDAYANWMYAHRYGELDDYSALLQDGLRKYPANPTLIYLKALLKHGDKNAAGNISDLERAVKLDPKFLDPWFALAVNYLAIGDIDKSDYALNNLLQQGAISDEIMDYSYNVLTLLEKDAILVTNGDNDTFPVWILTRIIKYRPDIKLINRSLLNTEWYPKYLIENEKIPEFITENELLTMRKEILSKIKTGEIRIPTMGPFSDTLLEIIIKNVAKTKKSIYFSSTLYRSDLIKKYRESGDNLGLVVKLYPRTNDRKSQIIELVEAWLNNFRTGGLTSWELAHGAKETAGKRLVLNYAFGLNKLLDEINEYIPNRRIELFNWYNKFVIEVVLHSKQEHLNSMWCKFRDIKKIDDWCNKNLF